jgi:hypothetical protein
MRAPTFDQNESIITTTTAPEEPVGFDTASLPGSGEENLEVSIPWSEGDRIPVQFTCKGSNVSPSVAWFDVSPEAVGIAIVMYEIGVDQTIHWIVANLDPARAFIESGELGTPDVPAGVVVGLNDRHRVTADRVPPPGLLPPTHSKCTPSVRSSNCHLVPLPRICAAPSISSPFRELPSLPTRRADVI